MPRELIEPRKGDKRFVRRRNHGQFKEVEGRSLLRSVAVAKQARGSPV